MATETCSAPAAQRTQTGTIEKRQQGALRRLTYSASLRVDELMQALERLSGRPYVDELVGIAASLHNRDIEGAVQGWRAIPWTYENEHGYGGLAAWEARDAKVQTASRALDIAMARLKVCFRFGRIPEPASQARPPQEPLLF